MQQLTRMTVEAFCEQTASPDSLPGGGSVASLGGAMGAALAQMMARLTLNREQYQAAHAAMLAADQALEPLRANMLLGVQRDTHAYTAYMRAKRLPATTQEERGRRQEAVEQALMAAVRVPLDNGRNALKALALTLEVLRLGNINILSDGLVAAMMLRTAVLGAMSNVRVNMAGLPFHPKRESILAACRDMERQAKSLERKARALTRMREGATT